MLRVQLHQVQFQEVVTYRERLTVELIQDYRTLRKGYHMDSKRQDMGIVVRVDYKQGFEGDGWDADGDSSCVRVNYEASGQLCAC